MKVAVSRQLSGGRYYLSFQVGEFTQEEIIKMNSFGVPPINLQWLEPPNNNVRAGGIPLNQIGRNYRAGFPTEEAAKEYEKSVLAQIQAAMQRLRESKDDFTSAQEVQI
jgi:hypothetical protein